MDLELVPLEENNARSNDDVSEEKEEYKGIERRKNVRRTHADRRSLVRFEENTERRTGNDRCAGSVSWASTV